jgi:hypothetical protein
MECGQVMAETDIRRPVTVEAQLRYYAGPCSICGGGGGKVALGQVYLRVLRSSPASIIPPMLRTDPFITDAIKP